MRANVRMLAEGGQSGAEQDIELELPARVIVTTTIVGWNKHVRIDIDAEGTVTVIGPQEVRITPNSTRKLEEA